MGKDQETVRAEELTSFHTRSLENCNNVFSHFFWQNSLDSCSIGNLKKGSYTVFFAHQLAAKPFSGAIAPVFYIAPMNDGLSAAMVTAKVPVDISIRSTLLCVSTPSISG